jgi:hypothetical protein
MGRPCGFEHSGFEHSGFEHSSREAANLGPERRLARAALFRYS